MIIRIIESMLVQSILKWVLVIEIILVIVLMGKLFMMPVYLTWFIAGVIYYHVISALFFESKSKNNRK